MLARLRLFSNITSIFNHLAENIGNVEKASGYANIVQSIVIRSLFIRNGINAIRHFVDIHFLPVGFFQVLS